MRNPALLLVVFLAAAVELLEELQAGAHLVLLMVGFLALVEAIIILAAIILGTGYLVAAIWCVTDGDSRITVAKMVYRVIL